MHRRIITVAESSPSYPRKSEGDIVELRDGRLLLIYMEFSGDGSDFARSRFVAQESADHGITWSGHRVIAETAAGDVNVYSPNLVRSSDGGILLTFMRQHRATPLATTMYAWKSQDEGQTFEPFSDFMSGRDFSVCNAVVKRLRCGRLLLPVSCTSAGNANAYDATALYSDDDGATWRQSANRVCLPMRGAMEPHVEQTRDGQRVLMVVRNQLGALFISESRDDGATWSLPQTTGLPSPESCPELTRIPSTGDLLMIWNNSPYDPAYASHFGKRCPLTAAVSKDDGRTWTHVRDIENDPLCAYSNPGCRFTQSGGAAVVNYWTCRYAEGGFMTDLIDERVALLDTDWFYGGGD